MFEQSTLNRIGFAGFVEALRRHIEQLPGHSHVVFDANSRTIRYQRGGQNYTINADNFYIDHGKSDGDLEPGSNERSLAEVRALPEGLRVSHAPGVVAASRSPQDGREFVWTFQTSLEAMDTDLSIVEYGAFRQLRGKWGPANGGERPFGPQQFAEEFAAATAH